MLRGAKDLSLQVEWRLRFSARRGERAFSTPGVLFIDIGEALAPGVVDHHGTVGELSTAILVLRRWDLVYNHLLVPQIQRLEAGSGTGSSIWQPTIVCHENPDFDALVAAHLAIRLVEDGRFPDYARALAGYAHEVEQGRLPLPVGASDPALSSAARQEGGGAPWLYALHLGYLAMEAVTTDSERLMLLGFDLLERELAAVCAARGGRAPSEWTDILPMAPGAGGWVYDDRFTATAKLLADDFALFCSDLEGATVLEAVPLPAADGGLPLQVRGLVLALPPKCLLDKHWVRAGGFPLLICPVAAEKGDAGYENLIISLDPNYKGHEGRPTLRGLGFALELAETAARQAKGLPSRSASPRYPGGYCNNADPWYDGRDHGWTIVAAPHVGTILSLGEVVEIVGGGGFWKIPLRQARVQLIWADAEAVAAAGRPLRAFPGMAPVLQSLFAESRAIDPVISRTESARHAGITTVESARSWPPGTCNPLRIVEAVADPGVALEDLVAWSTRIDGRSADFVFADVTLGTHFSSPDLVARLLRDLAGGATDLLEGGGEGVEVSANRRAVVLHRLAAPGKGVSDHQIVFEVLLYAVFLAETLFSFSQQISSLVPPSGAALTPRNTRPLRESFLRFQVRYFQIAPCSSLLGSGLFDHLRRELGIETNYQEIQIELDRLAELETQLLEERRAKAEKWLQRALFVIGVSQLISTVLALLTSHRNIWLDLAWIAPTVLVFLALFVWAKSR